MYAWVVAKSDQSIASYRVRCKLIMDELNRQGFPAELYSKENCDRYTLAVFSKYYSKNAIQIARQLKAMGKKVIFDISDNHFLLAQDRVADLEVMISLSDCIIVPAESLMELIQKKYNDCKVVVIEDPVEDFTLYLDDEKWRGTVSEWIRKIILQPWLYKHREKFNLVWFGAAQGSYKDSGLLHLGHKSSVLNAVNKTYPLTLTIISNSYYQYSKIKKHFDFPTCYMPWSLQSFAKVLKQHDCSIIPVDINEFTKVKSNNRAIQALYYHVPVIADPIASYIKLSDCMYINDWENNLLRVINNTAEKEEKLENASAYIEKYHTQAYITSKWLECFKEIEAHD